MSSRSVEGPPIRDSSRTGAGDGIRTRDPQLGRLMLYQLSYSRVLERSGRNVQIGLSH